MERTAIAVLAALIGCGRIAFDPTSDPRIDAREDPPGNRAFVTSTLHAPVSLGGLAGADAICRQRATEANLPGTFVAYLSTSTVDARDRLASAQGWYRVDNAPLANGVANLISEAMVLPLRIDERGVDLVDDTAYVATGTYDGVANSTCSDYTNPTELTHAGRAYMVGGGFSANNTIACSEPMRLYCFQTDFSTALTYTGATGRLAFVSAAEFTPNTGLATADSICAAEAQAAGRPGTFLALLPGTDTAASRFDLSGPPWVRLDGIALARTASEFMAAQTRAALNLTAQGVYITAYVVTGSVTPMTPPEPTRNCDGWTNAAGGNQLGYATASHRPAFEQTTAACTMPGRLYCLQQ